MARVYSNVVYAPVHVHGSDSREIMQWKIQWEKRMLDCFDMLPEVHPSFLYEADTDPYARKTTRDDGSEQSMKWDTSRLSAAEIKAESELMRRSPYWLLVYHIIGGGGKGCEAERASIDAVFRPVAEMEKQKRKQGQRGKIIEFRYFASPEEALQDFEEADAFGSLMEAAGGSQAALEEMRRQLWNDQDMMLDEGTRSLRLALPGEKL